MVKVSVIIPVRMFQGTGPMHKGMFVNFDATVDREGVEVIVVDNGSEIDGEWIKVHADKYARTEQPLGFTKAINLGMSQATGDYICQMNTDVKHENHGWIDRMRELCDKTGGIITAAPERAGDLLPNQAYGACWMMSRKVLEDIGPWDEAMNWRFSDQDYWIRATKAGYTVYLSTITPIVHENKHTWSRLDPDFKAKIKEEERKVMMDKHGVTEFATWINQHKI